MTGPYGHIFKYFYYFINVYLNYFNYNYYTYPDYIRPMYYSSGHSLGISIN